MHLAMPICGSRAKIPDNIKRENTLKVDLHAGRRFDYLLSNPPYGVDWKNAKDVVTSEHETLGYGGRFGMDYCFRRLRLSEEILGALDVIECPVGNQEKFAVLHLGFVLHNAVLRNSDAIQRGPDGG